MTIRFRVTAQRRGQAQNVTVVVYDTKKAMMAATKADDARWGRHNPDSWYRAGVAITSSVDGFTVDSAGKTVFGPHKRIIIRFWKKCLGTEIVSHEATHAAIRIYKGRRQGLRSIEHEEDLCYLVGELTRKIVNKLYDKGVWA